ncbi:MAG TPA: sn-glycerol-3-phosphate ABC transporter ATP-binding protein UgpC [Pararhizobium sp.]|uniref:ABC transporter ATP-binding protein n=1 Tax=Pararhizobium sp. TaxID=1977563 RepID=UPI002BF6F06B|nr:sn-glycerol-3-phosphate ABC transporter ATP-binding protein UgpC [Pararhizobium sp.]HTO30994.1 sn-glycerol-3-phosphate ABC transporter ATP-binding protein UgpC [Pararhizobium sp.]
MAQVSLDNLVKAYATVQVMHGVSFDVADGEFVALVGPSGCGKSTLLRMIAGLEDITGGTISIAGRVVNDVEPKERNLAMVFQNYALYPHMTVRDNMGFSLKLRNAPKAEIETRVREAAGILGLVDYLDRMPKQLSGGQRQRVAMGRAIVRQPAVFLFDEPLSNLDASLRVQMRAEIRALHDRLGSTSIFVTHDQVEAMTMADRIVVLRSGRLEQAGAPLELYDRPANAFVAGFIGSPAMNLIKGEAANGSIRLSPNLSVPSPVAATGPVIWGVRPEHLDLVPAEAPGAIDLRVAAVESTGHATFVMGEADGVAMTALFTDRPNLVRGDVIHLKPRLDKQHLFEAERGVRID